jgi:excinuclease UvrABC helicase subunit UvrB
LKSNKTKRDYSILDKKSLEKELAKLELEMDIASANMEYEKAAELRDAIIDLKKGKNKKWDT